MSKSDYNSSPILQAENLTVGYGEVIAINELSFHVDCGEIVVMVGPNGAGKSTVLKAVSGILERMGGRVIHGEILFGGESIRDRPAHELVLQGISLVPERRRIFPSMTVSENLEIGAYTKTRKADIKEALDDVLKLFPQLKGRLKQRAGTLSTGEQQMLAISRALMSRPKLLLADEPSFGLSPKFVGEIFDKLIAINSSGKSVLIVEQNANMALKICHRAYVFKIGSIFFQGDRDKVVNNPEIKTAYIGE